MASMDETAAVDELVRQARLELREGRTREWREYARESRAAMILQEIREWFEEALAKTRPWLSWDIGTDGPYPPTRPFAMSIETPTVGYDSIRDGARLLGIEAPEWAEAYRWAKARLDALREATRPQALEWARVREAEEEES